MFKSVPFLGKYADGQTINPIYYLNDSGFATEIVAKNCSWSGIIAAVCLEYQKRKLPVVKNAVLALSSTGISIGVVNAWKETFKEIEPELEYDKYASCVMRQYKHFLLQQKMHYLLQLKIR